jgi:hypothetical protein
MIILIDLSMNDSDIIRICEQENMDPDIILKNKKNGFHKLWINRINKDELIVFAFTRMGTKKIEAIEHILNDIQPLKVRPDYNIDNLNLDDILDRINDIGYNNLSDDEKNYLSKFDN